MGILLPAAALRDKRTVPVSSHQGGLPWCRSVCRWSFAVPDNQVSLFLHWKSALASYVDRGLAVQKAWNSSSIVTVRFHILFFSSSIPEADCAWFNCSFNSIILLVAQANLSSRSLTLFCNASISLILSAKETILNVTIQSGVALPLLRRITRRGAEQIQINFSRKPRFLEKFFSRSVVCARKAGVRGAQCSLFTER